MYPAIEPYDSGVIDVGDGHLVYWATCGNPDGQPALVLHGGPGSGCTPDSARYFNPERYRVVLMDQRGAGRSTPHASEPNVDLSTNTTHHVLADIERLRAHLGIERWLVRGGSWGSTLALAYAEQHPQRVTALVLNSIATTTPAEIEWISRGVGVFFPQAWARFRGGVPQADRDGSLVEAYHRLLMDSGPAVREKAARDWCDWETAIESAVTSGAPNPRYDNPAFRLGFARLVTHYWRHHAWIEDGALLRDADRLSGIPGVLIHGRLDLGTPLTTAWQLSQRWPGSELIVVDAAGHSAGDPGMGERIVAATDRLVVSR